MRVNDKYLRLSGLEPKRAALGEDGVYVDIAARAVFIDSPPDIVVGIIDGVGAALDTGSGVSDGAAEGAALSCTLSVIEIVLFASVPSSVRRYTANRNKQHRASPPTKITLIFSSIPSPPSDKYTAVRRKYSVLIGCPVV